jgi:hypothetical protein
MLQMMASETSLCHPYATLQGVKEPILPAYRLWWSCTLIAVRDFSASFHAAIFTAKMEDRNSGHGCQPSAQSERLDAGNHNNRCPSRELGG